MISLVFFTYLQVIRPAEWQISSFRCEIQDVPTNLPTYLPTSQTLLHFLLLFPWFLCFCTIAWSTSQPKPTKLLLPPLSTRHSTSDRPLISQILWYRPRLGPRNCHINGDTRSSRRPRPTWLFAGRNWRGAVWGYKTCWFERRRGLLLWGSIYIQASINWHLALFVSTPSSRLKGYMEKKRGGSNKKVPQNSSYFFKGNKDLLEWMDDSKKDMRPRPLPHASWTVVGKVW